MRLSLSLFLVFIVALSSLAQDYSAAIEKARFLILEHQKQTQIPGVQVALMIDDSLIWSEAMGFRDLDAELPVESDTKFRVASISKSITSLALAKLMEEDQIDIDKDIKHYLPEFPEKEYPITTRQLASSTSGIRHYTEKDPRYNEVHYPDILSALEKFENDPLLFKPGTAYQYSSYGWVLLSAVMEKASGKSFFDLMENAWDELGITHTAFDYPNSEDPEISKFYIKDGKKGRVIAPKDNRSYMYAGGGFLSTAEDLVHMGSVLLGDEYIQEKTRKELFRSQVLADGSETHYGLGWETGVNRLGTRVVFHGGSLSSARSHLIIYPEENVVFAYIANTGDQIFFNDREAQTIAEIFVQAKEESGTPEKLHDIEGKWKVMTTSLRNRKSKGKLELAAGNGMLSGTLTFKRSRKKKSFPIILTDHRNDLVHFVAVSPMFIDLYLDFDGEKFSGNWLHDFNVKGVPEEDDYWNARDITGEKTLAK